MRLGKYIIVITTGMQPFKISKTRVKIAKYLLENGADPHLKENSLGLTALDGATRINDGEMIKILERYHFRDFKVSVKASDVFLSVLALLRIGIIQGLSNNFTDNNTNNNGKYNIQYSSDDIEQFLYYFFDVAN